MKFIKRIIHKILIRRFEKIAHTAQNDKTYRKAHDEWVKSTDELLSELKGTSKGQRRHRSAKVQKAISKPGKDRTKAIRDLGKDLGYID